MPEGAFAVMTMNIFIGGREDRKRLTEIRWHGINCYCHVGGRKHVVKERVGVRVPTKGKRINIGKELQSTKIKIEY